jgi:hypothetical protein
MVRGIAEMYGEALIAPSYYITIKVLGEKDSFVNIRVDETATSQPLAREHHPILSVANEFMHLRFEWDSTSLAGYNFGPKTKYEYARIHEEETNSIARDIRNLLRQWGCRVLDDKRSPWPC